MMCGRRLWVLRLSSVAIGTTVLLVVLELTFWILPVREGSPRIPPSDDDRIARFQADERWRYSAGWNFYISNEMRTNNAGWVSDIDYVRKASTPLLAFVGDSYVEGDHLPWSDTCHGRLAARWGETVRVYSFGVNAAPLSQYLAYAEYARDAYGPVGLVIPIIENDFDESLLQWSSDRFFAFEEQPDGGFVLAPPRVPPTSPKSLFAQFRRWVNVHSSLARYRTYHVGFIRTTIRDERRRNDWSAAGDTATPFRETDPAVAHPERVATSRRAVDVFLRMLPDRSGLDPEQIVFVVDGIRPYRYTEGWEHRWDGSYHDVMRRYFMDQARAGGFEVIDMQPVFVGHYRSHQQSFNWPLDLHWNPLGHGLCAEQVAQSAALRRIQAATAAPETNK